ncbi:hypothetical protein CSA08_01890 [Candidatus Gracilibacteria bacterium]|nr:MAG: hypothetical protein CSA08_01890 [Candidatus Gracilibacteria bacterium]
MLKIKEILKLTGLPVLFASMCCLSPIIILLFGFGSISFATSLTDTLYGEYKWLFRLFGLFLLGISLIFYFRSKGICTLDKAKREKKRIINTILVTLFVGIAGYMFFLYVVVHYIGVFLKIWE